ncbi:hypothetical protein T310_3421 [Rasamsonia emersonii CBS 393.64]|uniref:Uncharacterized protein n=1 Tax=Rasamsonia emersonii (strain ATCC 16479 / CBS 393.64 / IMI 116815) TaxID=1408163 RepID=A0A0F4YY21_RASE3|nr:hypothetical protein T310_3421 [Rasamsonia emersonii CBS 393.64]KKA22538.1 hypothetical protein T310_3421 [Rasamsonia emersonii CBS 393.64]
MGLVKSKYLWKGLHIDFIYFPTELSAALRRDTVHILRATAARHLRRHQSIIDLINLVSPRAVRSGTIFNRNVAENYVHELNEVDNGSTDRSIDRSIAPRTGSIRLPVLQDLSVRLTLAGQACMHDLGKYKGLPDLVTYSSCLFYWLIIAYLEECDMSSREADRREYRQPFIYLGSLSKARLGGTYLLSWILSL